MIMKHYIQDFCRREFAFTVCAKVEPKCTMLNLFACLAQARIPRRWILVAWVQISCLAANLKPAWQSASKHALMNFGPL
jgi:hypothetical protein